LSDIVKIVEELKKKERISHSLYKKILDMSLVIDGLSIQEKVSRESWDLLEQMLKEIVIEIGKDDEQNNKFKADIIMRMRFYLLKHNICPECGEPLSRKDKSVDDIPAIAWECDECHFYTWIPSGQWYQQKLKYLRNRDR